MDRTLRPFTTDPELSSLASEANVRYETFENFATEGGVIDGVFLGCSFTNVDWYWGLFNMSVFVESTFQGCTFRGSAFSGCIFVECTFVGCHFVKDNLGGECSFEDSRWYGCQQSESTGLPASVPVTTGQ